MLLLLAIVIGLVVYIFDGMPGKLRNVLTVIACVFLLVWMFAILGIDIVGMVVRK